MYAITLSEYMIQKVKSAYEFSIMGGVGEKFKYDAIFFVSENLELTNTVRDYLETLDKTRDSDILMALLMVKYLGFIGPNEKLFQVISLDNEYTDYMQTFPGVLYAKDFIYIEGVMNSRSDDKNIAIKYHNTHFGGRTLSKIRRILGKGII